MIGGLQGENEDLNNKYLRKNLKESVTNIWKHLGLQHATWAARFRKLKVFILHKKADFAVAKLAFSLV